MNRPIHHAILVLLALCFLALPAPARCPTTLSPEGLPIPPAPVEREFSPHAEGVLLGEDGQPAANVQVLLEISDMRIRRQVGYDKTMTDLGGRFRFDLEDYAQIPRLGLQFNTVSPRYREAVKIIQLDWEELPAVVEITLSPGSSARGTIRDEEGNPVEGAEISGPGIRPVRSDAEGKFEIYGLYPSGTTPLTALKPDYTPETIKVVSSTAGLIEDLEFVLRQSAAVQGRVVDPTGAPVTEGTVYIRRTDGSHLNCAVDGKGTFSFPIVPINLDGLGLVFVSQDFLEIDRPFKEEEKTSRNVTLEAQWPLRIQGQVLNPDNSPASGSEIAIELKRRDFPARIPTDSQGRFEAAPFLTNGEEIIITALPANPSGRVASGELEILEEVSPGKWTARVAPWPKGYSSEIDVVINDGQITMTRRDSGIGALPGIIRYEGTMGADMDSMKGTLVVEETGATGEFQARAYAPSHSLRGVWDLRETISEGAVNKAPSQKKFIGAPFPGIQHVSLQLSTPGIFSGTVLMADGTGLPTGEVRLIQWNRSSVLRLNAPIQAGGRFRFDVLPDGVLLFVVLDSDNTVIIPPFYARAGIENMELRQGAMDDDPVDALTSAVK